MGYSPWGQKESDMTEDAHTHNLLPEDDGRNLTFHFHALEKEMATHSSVLAT